MNAPNGGVEAASGPPQVLRSARRDVRSTLTSICPSAVYLTEYLTTLCGEGIADKCNPVALQLARTIMIIPPHSEGTSGDNSGPALPAPLKLPAVNQQVSVNIRELINWFIGQEFSKSRQPQTFRSMNCLCQGYRPKNVYSTSEVRSNYHIEMYAVNTGHSMLCTSDWQQLARTLGENVLLHLFSRPLFLLRENGCYLQLCGTLISEMSRQQSASESAEHFNSHRLLLKRTENMIGSSYNGSSSGSNSCTVSGWNGQYNAVEGVLPVADGVEVPRFKMFYCHQYEKSPGLPSKHALNKVTDCAHKCCCCVVIATAVYFSLSLMRRV
jgi:hypothetical protein